MIRFIILSLWIGLALANRNPDSRIQCHKPGLCATDFFSTTTVKTEKDCQELCYNEGRCMWSTWIPSFDNCTFYDSSCPLDNDSCGDQECYSSEWPCWEVNPAPNGNFLRNSRQKIFERQVVTTFFISFITFGSKQDEVKFFFWLGRHRDVRVTASFLPLFELFFVLKAGEMTRSPFTLIF